MTKLKPSLNWLKTTLSKFPERSHDWILRGIFAIILIAYFCLTVHLGPIAIMSSTLAIQVKCFQEIINIGYNVYRVPIPWFRSVSWFFLIATNYFFYGETIVEYFMVYVTKYEVLRTLTIYHRFISFCLYFLGLLWFILSLVRKYDMEQFSLLAWTHVALLIIVTQSYLTVKNIFQGLIWLIMPVTLVICNDIFAYIFGKFFGKTPLIQLSPKKTWEGFIGGGISTVVYGCIISYILCQYPYFVCPINYNTDGNGYIKMKSDCQPGELFQLKNYTTSFEMGWLDFEANLQTYPFIFHSFFLSSFSSVIGPFGGFFASGFKRAFKVKDFGDAIPGHGGIVDRFDCQFLMGTFVNVYIGTFIKDVSPERIASKVLYLRDEEQKEFFFLLERSLSDRNLLNFTV